VHSMGVAERIVRATLFTLLIVINAAGPARANWLTSIVREAGEVGGETAGRAVSHLGPVGKAAAYLTELSAAPKGALAAHATPEGHWQFVNRDGETFTVGTTDEMSRVLPTLAPDAVASGHGKLTLYVSEDSVFANRAALDQIPHDADLYVVTDDGAFPLTRTGKGGDQVLTAHVKPHLAIDLVDQALFEETAFLLARPLNKSNIRTIALEPGAGKSMTSAPKLDPETKVPLVDQLDPGNLYDGLRSIRGQTALVTGRAEGGKLVVSPSSGPEVSLAIDDLIESARGSDVKLVVLQSDANRQAGGRNWLWQKIEVGGLNEAAGAATFGDFLDALAARRGGFKLTADRNGADRVHVSAVPDPASTGLTGEAGNAIADLVSHVTGEVITKAVELDARDQSTEKEHDARLIPGVPTYIQYPYLAGLIAGLAGWATARRWWGKIVPKRAAAEAGSGAAARIARLPGDLAFLLVFLPLAGMPAFFVHSVLQMVEMIVAPFRWIRRKFLISKV